VHHHGEVDRALHGGDAEAPHFLRQARLGLVDAVLHQLLGEIRVGADLEGDGERHGAVGGRLAAHIEHVLDAVDLLLDRRGDGLRDHLWARARVARAHHHRRRRNLGIFRDRQQAERDRPAEQDQDRENAGEDRPVDEELREIHFASPGVPAG
jgi:hypothetical protein